ncbi:MAG: ribosome small subunit-dependent GTPase A [Defluviitaleaceae bacterium]|nr:ribosome small subunit-dependent GTPase A [Defluviitaleaceae bacterium]
MNDYQIYNGRVISQHKNLYRVVCDENDIVAEISGKLKHSTANLSDFPTVGDFVSLDRNNNKNGNAVIVSVLPRKTAFIRKAAGKRPDDQIVAANIDIAFICMSLNNDFNLRRLERYLAVAWESGAMPIVLLTKSDLCFDTEEMKKKVDEVSSVAMGVDIVTTSSIFDKGMEQVLDFIKEGKTAVFIGSSGVGKSTIINRILGSQILKTSATDSDDKGRHTTTTRSLFFLSNGGYVIDTPGMRELGIENADFSKSFVDIDELAEQCKFNDCNHTSEPGCAVKKAIKDNLLTQARLDNYRKLKREASYSGLTSRKIQNNKLNEMFKDVGGMKKAKKLTKNKL